MPLCVLVSVSCYYYYINKYISFFLQVSDEIHLVKNAPPLSSIVSSRPNSNFGKIVKLADMDNDGYDDLLIGAPAYQEVGVEQIQGCAFIILGSSGGFPSGDIEDVADWKVSIFD
jgi:hypothetical protein